MPNLQEQVRLAAQIIRELLLTDYRALDTNEITLLEMRAQGFLKDVGEELHTLNDCSDCGGVTFGLICDDCAAAERE